MLVIRLARTGRRNQPKFRVAVAEHSKPVNGKVVEVVGHFNPTIKKDPLTINKEAIESWISKGAQPSNTVSRLLNKHAGFSLEVKQHPERKPKKEVESVVASDKAVPDQGEKPAEPASDDSASANADSDKPASSDDDSGKDSDKGSDKKSEPSTSDDATPTDEQSGGQAGEAGK